MISQLGSKLRRPGVWIPVFFLSLMQAKLSGQEHWPGCASAGLGGSFVCLAGSMSSSQNQAGLGFTEHSSISIQHGRPFLLKELGVSSISGQFRTGKGALGISLSTLGLKGLSKSSLWLAYGQKLHPKISAGLGLHLWNTSIPEHYIYAPGISFSLGLQFRICEHWKFGARIFHPVAWQRLQETQGETSMRIESGFAYSFFNVARVYSELHMLPGAPLILCGGAEWILNRQILFRTGICSDPFTCSWGISLEIKNLRIEFSVAYRSYTGLSPTSAFTYGW